VHPREVFRAAIAEAAAGIIVVHNHPSGDPTPSQEDRAVTRQLVEAGRLLDLPVYDHLILAGDRFVSFATAGLLEEPPAPTRCPAFLVARIRAQISSSLSNAVPRGTLRCRGALLQKVGPCTTSLVYSPVCLAGASSQSSPSGSSHGRPLVRAECPCA
jgi:hypothetical protein